MVGLEVIENHQGWRANDVNSMKQRFRKATDALAVLIREHREQTRRRAAAFSHRQMERALLVEQRDAERRNRALWSRFKVRPEIRGHAKHKPKETKRPMVYPNLTRARPQGFIPRYSGAIIDRHGRRGIFLKISYYGSKTKPGVSSRVTKYIAEGALQRDDGRIYFQSNVGDTMDEAVQALSLIEDINRSVQRNGKILFHGIANVPYQLDDPELMMKIGHEFVEQQFGSCDLPYALALHPPSAEGDQRNWHLHFLFSTRPMVRTGPYEWDVGHMLRTEIDNPEVFDRMRHVYASIQTEVAREAGLGFTYTALSNAERGLPNAPQRHLGSIETAKVRRGEFSAVNDRNIGIVMAGEAALLDEQMRHARERAEAEAAIIDKALETAVKLRPMQIAPPLPISLAADLQAPQVDQLPPLPIRAANRLESPLPSPRPFGVSVYPGAALRLPTLPAGIRMRMDGAGLQGSAAMQRPIGVSNLKPTVAPVGSVPVRTRLARAATLLALAPRNISITTPLAPSPIAIPSRKAVTGTVAASAASVAQRSISLSASLNAPVRLPNLPRPAMTVPVIGRANALGTSPMVGMITPNIPMPPAPKVLGTSVQQARPISIGPLQLADAPLPSITLPLAARIASPAEDLAALDQAIRARESRATQPGLPETGQSVRTTIAVDQPNPSGGARAPRLPSADLAASNPSPMPRTSASQDQERRPKPSSHTQVTGTADSAAETVELLAFVAERRKRRAARSLKARLAQANTPPSQPLTPDVQRQPDHPLRPRQRPLGQEGWER